MFAKQYYYFVAGLPNIGFEDGKAIYTPQTFRGEASEKLCAHDLSLLDLLTLPAELDNLLIVLYKLERESKAECLISPDEWESLIAYLKPNPDHEIRFKTPVQSWLPKFVSELLSSVLAMEEMLPLRICEQRLLELFYEHVAKVKNEFINKWFELNREMQNIMIALSGRKYELPYAEFLIGKSETVDKLAKSQAADFGLGKQFPLFDSLMRIFELDNILERERQLDALRWRWIENQNFFEYFNIDRILGYYSQLRILDRWIKLDPESGKEIFFDTLNALENSFSFPEEFDLKQKVKQ